MVGVRWPDGVVTCPRCGSSRVTYLASSRVWKCYERHDRAKFWGASTGSRVTAFVL